MTETDYQYEERNSKLDFTKKQILTRQENFKILLPFLLAVVIGGTILNVYNALEPFMSTYLTVLVDVVLCAAAVWIAYYLAAADIHNRADLRALHESVYAGLSDVYERYVYLSDSRSLLKGRAKTVRYYPRERTLVPELPNYRHRVWNDYDFKCDFGRLRFPEAASVLDGGTVIETKDIRIELKRVDEQKSLRAKGSRIEQGGKI